MMKSFQSRVAATLTSALLLTGFAAQAQEAPENYVPYPYAFVGVQGGVQTTFTDYNNAKLFTPTASVSFGVQFTPVIGARLHVNGIWNKGGVSTDDFDVKYRYKYATTDLDLMVNMVNLLSKDNYHPLDIYLIGGVGLNYAWGTHNAPTLSQKSLDSRLSHNFRVGTMFDYKLTRNLSVNVEVDANSLSDRFNCKTSHTDDWQLTAQVGVTYRFGISHKVKSDPHSNIFVDPNTIGTSTETGAANTNVNIDKPAPAPAPAPAPVVAKKESITRNIFFGLRESSISATEQTKIAEVAKWLKEHPTAKVTVTGYADKNTGNPKVNEQYAKNRADIVTKELTKKYGIGADRITTVSKGDSEQPFTENEKNRVTIVIGQE